MNSDESQVVLDDCLAVTSIFVKLSLNKLSKIIRRFATLLNEQVHDAG